MKFLFSVLSVSALAGALVAPAAALPPMGVSVHAPCPTGKHWVKTYTTKKGVVVKGHCSL